MSRPVSSFLPLNPYDPQPLYQCTLPPPIQRKIPFPGTLPDVVGAMRNSSMYDNTRYAILSRIFSKMFCLNLTKNSADRPHRNSIFIQWYYFPPYVKRKISHMSWIKYKFRLKLFTSQNILMPPFFLSIENDIISSIFILPFSQCSLFRFELTTYIPFLPFPFLFQTFNADYTILPPLTSFRSSSIPPRSYPRLV